ncbi:AMP-binding protein [Hoeflea sp.]|uniref:AMP-binding protein n=1 Tax=Hoeflea sp. TaxID=1940281 RepID=UPI003BAFC495
MGWSDPHLQRREANFQPLNPVRFLARENEAHPERTAVIWRDRSWTYGQFNTLAVRLADLMRGKGIGQGDVVSILSRNRPEMLAAHFSVPGLGAVLNTINTRLDAEAIAYILRHAETKLLLVDEAVGTAALQAANEVGVTVVRLSDTAGEGETPDLLSGDIDPDARLDERAITDEWQPVCLNYTSGTTGNPKGVVYHARGAFLNAMGNALSLGFGAGTRYLWTLPMFHCNGWAHTWAVTAAGGTHVCLDAVDPAAILDLVADAGITHMSCAPVVLYMLLNDPKAAALKGTDRRVSVATGGAAPTASLISQLDAIGFDLVHLYGLTESYGPASIGELADDMAGDDAATKAEWLARQGVRHKTSGDIRIVDAETGVDRRADGSSAGEILLRGNTLMAGYHKDPEATEAAFADGWFHTGDIAVREPDGAMRITDRAKDVIISGGENISSLEVESVLHRHPAVMLAAVVAMPNEKWGETPCAFIELKPGSEVDAEDLMTFCRSHLAGFKVPRQFIFNELPKTATGKIQKFVLREQARGYAQ